MEDVDGGIAPYNRTVTMVVGSSSWGMGKPEPARYKFMCRRTGEFAMSLTFESGSGMPNYHSETSGRMSIQSGLNVIFRVAREGLPRASTEMFLSSNESLSITSLKRP
jgi:hypothetical protein